MIFSNDHAPLHGWNLDRRGREIDFSANGTGAEIEANIVADLAERYRQPRTAAE